MIIREIRCGGFRGIRKPIQIDVPQGFLVLTGRNGAGKSSLCDAVEFALTGALRRHEGGTERRERIEDYVWWRGRQEAPERYVTVVFATADGDDFTVTRTPSGLLSPDSQDEIIAALCIRDHAPTDPLVRLLRTAIVRDEEITRLSIDLPERERFDFVRSAIGETELPGYIARLDQLNASVKEFHASRVKDYESKRDAVKGLLQRIAESRVDVAEVEDLAKAQETLAEYLGTVDDVDEMLRSARRMIVDLRGSAARLRQLGDELARLERRREEVASDEYEVERKQIAEEMKEVSESLSEADQACEATRAALNEASAKAGDFGSWAAILEHGEEFGLRDGRCPLCGSEVADGEFQDHIEEARKLIRGRNERLSRLTAENLGARKDRDELKDQLESLRERFEAHEKAAVGVERRVDAVLDEATSLGVEEHRRSSSDLRAIAEERREDARRLERAAMLLESSAKVAGIEELQERLEGAREERATLEAAVLEAERAQERAKAAFDAVRRIERDIIDERLAELGPLLEELYLRLRPHVDWPTVRYRLRGDVQHYLSFEVGDDLNPRFMFSSGQRRAMGIAFLLAVYLSTSWTRLCTLILDDPVQHVDDFRALHMAEVLNGIRKKGRQIICSAEDPELARLMTRRLQGINGQSGALVELAYHPGEGVVRSRYEVINPVQERVLDSVS